MALTYLTIGLICVFIPLASAANASLIRDKEIRRRVFIGTFVYWTASFTIMIAVLMVAESLFGGTGVIVATLLLIVMVFLALFISIWREHKHG